LEVMGRNVIPAEVGIQGRHSPTAQNWIPACAGVTQWQRIGRYAVLTLIIWLGITRSDCLAAFAVQVGAFRSNSAANRQIEKISGAGFSALLETIARPGKPALTAVLVGPFDYATDAESARSALSQGGIDGYVRYYSNRRNPIGAVADTRVGPSSTSTDAGITKLISTQLISDETPPSNSWFRRIAAASASEPAQPSPDTQPKASSALPFKLSGHAQTAIAYTVAEPDHWSKIKNSLHLAVERALNADINLKISGRFSYDGAYDVSNFYPDRVKRDQRLEAMFHETYLDVGLNDWNFRVGRQNVVWGEVVGLFFADVVTAKDLREYIIPEFDYIRIPQWATRAEYFTGDFKAEAIWIPYTTYDQIGKPGSEFYPFTIPPPPGFRQVIRSERTPHSLRDSSFGLRASYLTHGWDLAAFYYGSMDSNATFFRSAILAPVPTIRYRPDHERIHQTGLTLSKDTGSFVFKAEAIYTWDRNFTVTNASDANGVVRQSFLDYILSAEIPLPMESRVNLQFFQRIFTNHDRDIIPRQVENGATLLASTKLFNEKVEPEFLMIQSLNRLDYMTRFKINWYFAKDWRLVAGAAFFGGKKLGLFGQFDNRDRVFTELRYSF